MIIISGKVVKGKGIGRKMGFPTLNIEYGDMKSGEDEFIGVFVGEVFVDNEWKKAAVHIGKNLTVGGDSVVCESYLIDWNGKNLAGKEIEVRLIEKIRDTVKFNNLEDLKIQISKDVEFVRNWKC